MGPENLGGGWKWCAAARARDGRLFFLPRNARDMDILVFDPASGKHRLLRHPNVKSMAWGSRRNLYNGAVLGADGCIYGVPASASRVLRIDPQVK